MGGGWGMPFFGLGPLLLIAIVVGGRHVYYAANSNDGTRIIGPTARGILDRRYAAGELSKEQ